MINEVNINGLEDVYNYIRKASKSNVPSGNLSLIKNLVLKVLQAVDKKSCDYNNAVEAIEDIFSIGRRANRPVTAESAEVKNALNLLKENGYIVESKYSYNYSKPSADHIYIKVLKALYDNGGYLEPAELKEIAGIREGTDQSMFAAMTDNYFIKYDNSRNKWFIMPDGLDLLQKVYPDVDQDVLLGTPTEGPTDEGLDDLIADTLGDNEFEDDDDIEYGSELEEFPEKNPDEDFYDRDSLSEF
jgi:hypothetical protein